MAALFSIGVFAVSKAARVSAGKKEEKELNGTSPPLQMLWRERERERETYHPQYTLGRV